MQYWFRARALGSASGAGSNPPPLLHRHRHRHRHRNMYYVDDLASCGGAVRDCRDIARSYGHNVDLRCVALHCVGAMVVHVAVSQCNRREPTVIWEFLR